MINHITGTLFDKEDKSITVQVSGLGYKIFISENSTSLLPALGEIFSIWIHQVIRDDSNTLYGFLQKEELKFFELLISISGIGPKTALGVMNNSPIKTLKKAVSQEDLTHLTKVSGIGKKVAEKMILELKNKFDNEDVSDTELRDDVDALEALKALGFSHKDAKEALETASKTAQSTEDKIRLALKLLK